MKHIGLLLNDYSQLDIDCLVENLQKIECDMSEVAFYVSMQISDDKLHLPILKALNFFEKTLFQKKTINPFINKSISIYNIDFKEFKEKSFDLVVTNRATFDFSQGALSGSIDEILYYEIDKCFSAENYAGFKETISNMATTSFTISRTKSAGHAFFQKEYQVIASLLAYKTRQNLKQCLHHYLAKNIFSYLSNQKIEEEFISKPLQSKKTNKFKISLVDQIYYPVAVCKNIIKWLLLKNKQEAFGVAFTFENNIPNNLSRGIKVKNLEKHYFADPFLYKKNGRMICFVENYDCAQKKGKISALEIFEDGTYSLLGDVLEEQFHLSYPFVFEFNNDIYMLPETSGCGELRLYKCQKFPMQWQYFHTLMTDVKCVDSMLLEVNSQWCLLTNMVECHDSEVNTNLSIFFADSPLSKKWQPHPQNPVVSDATNGRNGGLIHADEGYVRVSQGYDFLNYGAYISGNKINVLNQQEYRETLLFVKKPDFFDSIQGCHHLHNRYGCTVYDYKKSN